MVELEKREKDLREDRARGHQCNLATRRDTLPNYNLKRRQ